MTFISTMGHAGALRVTSAAVLSATAAFGVSGCGLLDVTNPTAIDEEDASNATGADLMRRDALRQFYEPVDHMAFRSGLLADEFHVVPSNPQDATLLIDKRLPDQSRFEDLIGNVGQMYQWSHATRHAATLALRKLAENAPESRRGAHMGQMFAVRGYAALRLAEDFCPGFPLHELDGYTPVYGPPLTTEQVLERALADLDAAVVHAADSARILNFARVVRGRTLLGLGRFADAASAVAAVPSGYVHEIDYGTGTSGSHLLHFRSTSSGQTIADQKGGNGLDFISAGDPRLGTHLWATARDGITELYRADKYLSPTSPIVLASGIEARLIEAEAALETGGPWLQILNDLRATQVSPGMAPISDPGTADARVDLLFRERAFWLFGTGQRLSDLRRLIRQYGRASETVFPSGPLYGNLTSLPFPAELERPFSPSVTGCTSQ